MAEGLLGRVPSLVALLRERAELHPERTLYTFLEDGELAAGQDVNAWTYGDLDTRARAIAAELTARGLRGARALLLYPPGLDFIAGFLGCLYAGVAAVPAYPPRSRRSLPRLLSIAEDARPAVALTDAATLAQVAHLTADLPGFGPERWLATDGVDLSLAAAWQDPGLTPEDLAFLQYTSGSTAAPKGVMVSHGNLLANEAAIQTAFGVSESSVIVGWLPLYHDMGLIGNVLQPLAAGASCVLMSPVAFLQRPARWLAAISRFRGTVSGGPNFGYDLCVEKIRPEDRAGLDLSCWSVAYNGAEPVRAETLERFARAFAPHGFARRAFYPCYGLAEATLFVTGGAPGAGATVAEFASAALEGGQGRPPAAGEVARALVSSGRIAAGHRVVVVETESALPVAAGQVGEVWVHGPSVAGGYFRQPEATAECFGATLDGLPYLRTGDLGFLADGELFVTGRLKDLIILRGRNLYPQDLERSAEEAHPALRKGNAAAFGVDAAGQEALVVVIEADRRREDEAPAAAEAIRRALAQEHEVMAHDVAVVRAGTIPKTSSGKIQRRACRGLWQRGELERLDRLERPDPQDQAAGEGTAGPETPAPAPRREELVALEPAARTARLVAYLRDRAARAARIVVAAVDPAEPLTNSGLDSLGAVELKHLVAGELGIELPIAAILEGASVDDLAALASRGELPLAAAAAAPAGPAGSASPAGGPGAARLPLSPGQQALWFLHRLAPESPAYNIAGAARVVGPLDADALARALTFLWRRHPLLRARLYRAAGRGGFALAPVSSELPWTEEDITTWSAGQLADRLAADAAAPFDLEAGPLFRAHLYRGSAQESYLGLGFHHIISDLWSVAIVVRELQVLYPLARGGAEIPADALPALPATHQDHVARQEQYLGSPAGLALGRWWQERLAGAPPSLQLPTDHPRPAQRRLLGQSVSRWFAAPLRDQVAARARAHRATPFMVLMAGFQALLFRLTGQADVVVGTPTTGRAGYGSSDLPGVIGYFVNPVAVRTDLDGDPTGEEVVLRARDAVRGALAHQDYPFPRLAEELGAMRDLSRSPIFEVMLVFQVSPFPSVGDLTSFALGRAQGAVAIGDLEFHGVELPIQGSQFDLSLYLAEERGGYGATLQYDSDLFDPSTLERWLGAFENLLVAVAGAPRTPLAELPLLSPTEQRQLLAEWAPGPGRSLTAAAETTLPALFAAQVAASPQAEALIVGKDRFTYQQLDRAANRFARQLRALGVGLEEPVGVYAQRSADLVVALLAVQRAGAAYVPMDPAYPVDRVAMMVEDSQMRVLITEPALNDRVPASVAAVVDLTGVSQRGDDTPLPASGLGPDHLSHVIYTSGSTGRPKGVAIQQRSCAALMAWSHQVFSAAEVSGLLASTSICFDLSVFELFVPLTRGGRVILAANALVLPELPAVGEVTLINTVPSAITELLKAGALPPAARTVCLAGEPLRGALVEAIYSTGTVDRVLNLYGPSEDTTYSTLAACAPGGGEPTIGHPLPSSRGYVVDRALQPVPAGVPGELLLGGIGLARGYLRRPGLTAERFVPDPFASTPGSRLYRTGDLVRYRADGELEFLGRLDHQVKIRGFRIELGEVEITLASHPAIEETVVMAWGEGGDRELVAYLVLRPGAAAPSIGSLRAFLAERMPGYMVPGYFVTLAAMPRTPNGKIDRKVLPAPTGERATGLGQEYVAPETEVELILAEIWREVLGVERVGIRDSFLDLGGHSLKANQLLLRVRDTFGIELQVLRLFEQPTIEGLSQAIAEALMADEAGAEPR